MKKISYLQAEKKLRALDTEGFDRVNITLLRNITHEPIETYLKWYLAENKQVANCSFGGFDNIFQDSLNDSLINSATNIVHISYDINFAFPQLKYAINIYSAEQIQKIEHDFIEFVQQVNANISARSQGVILWNSFIADPYPISGIADDNRADNSLNILIQSLNMALQQCCQQQANTYVINTQHLVSLIGYSQFQDDDKAISYAAPYSNYALQCLAQKIALFSAKTRGIVKKCLVLDCDNTLWGGVIGEDDINNLQLGGSLLGEKFQLFQRYVKSLLQQGTILALCSKNNSQDIWQVFTDHEEMILCQADIVCAKINWENKAVNIANIAKELNIGLDAMVFVDDNPMECELIKQQLPEVTVIQFSPDPLTTIRHIQQQGYFDNLAITKEDASKTQYYQQQVSRSSLAQQTSSLDDFIRSLEIKLTVHQSLATEVKRISQLSQKTNQFNLTTTRLNQAEVEQLMQSEHSDIYSVSVQDKFGELGLVGAVLLSYENNTAHIQNIVLSCRSLGRKIEHYLIEWLCAQLQQQKFERITAEYIPSEKNQQTQDFYSTVGFDIVATSSDKRLYSLSLTKNLPANYRQLMTLDFSRGNQ